MSGCKTISRELSEISTSTQEDVLKVKNLRTTFRTERGLVHAVDDISFSIKESDIFCLVGESGSGKSVTSLSIMGLLPEGIGYISSGSIHFDGHDLSKLDRQSYQDIRGEKIAMIFQEPMTALNPVFTVGRQVAEVFKIHYGYSHQKAMAGALEMFDKVKIPDARRRLHEYPHQLSGGMKQRVMIAMALACRPKLLIADEPTTALDVTVQSQILHLMQELQEEEKTSILFITHDLGVVAQIADHVAVMYAGKIVEQASVHDLFEKTSHPYTEALLKSIPSLEQNPGEDLFTIDGSVPSLSNLPKGCRFRTRCSYQSSKCHETPPENNIGKDHAFSCFADIRRQG